MMKLAALCLLGVALAADYYQYDEATRKGMLGTRLDQRGAMTQGVKSDEATEIEAMKILKSLPSSYDAATAEGGKCANTINFIKDQAACGSCWAVAASSALADRFCLKCGYGANSNNNKDASKNAGVVPNEALPGFELSAEELMSCCKYCGDGCQGGYPIDAMRRAYSSGFLTGGWFASQCGCQAYKIAPVHQALQPTPACSSQCDDGSYPEKTAADRHRLSSYKYVRGEAKMMKEIMDNGPIECAFSVRRGFETFFKDPANAKKVYTGQQSDEDVGGHAIKIVGWGQQMQDGQMVKYWQIHNSWNTTWADNGQFKFIRGDNFCGMEEGCVAGTPKCSNSAKIYDSLQCKGRDY